MNERTDQIVSLMCIKDDIKPYSNGGVIMVWGLIKTVIYHVFMNLHYLLDFH